MSEPILLRIPPRDPRETLHVRLENAPQEHAEALLAVYDVIQGLHDKGLLELAKGALGSGEKVLEIAVDAVNTPEVIQGIRNFIILTKLLAMLDPKLLENLTDAVPQALVEAKAKQPLGFLQLLGKASNSDTRRVLTMALRVMESLGKDLGSKKSGDAPA